MATLMDTNRPYISDADWEDRILYEDEDLIAVNKPSGIFTHPSALSGDRYTVMLALRERGGGRVYPLHRLDRPTSGVLLFARSSEAASEMAPVITASSTVKRYWAIVRGWPDEHGRIERSLRQVDGTRMQEAVTAYRTLSRAVWPEPVGAFEEARFALVEARPETGRQHQIRRHLRGIDHPLINDTVYGDGRQNRYFRLHFGVRRLLLQARAIAFFDPRDGARREIVAPLDPELAEIGARFSWPMTLHSSLSGPSRQSSDTTVD